MSGYTIKGLDNLLEKIMEKIDNIINQMQRLDESSEKYYILSESYDRYIVDYANLLDQKMDLYAKIQNRRNIGQN